MTVPADTVTRLSYTGSGTTGPFTTPYFLANADLRVVKTLIADGTETILALTTDYTLTGAGDEDGGALTLVSSLSSSYRLSIINDPVDSQETGYPRTDPFPAASHELALDRRTMVSLRHQDQIGRSLRQPDGDSAAIAELPPKVTRASKYLVFDANGDPTVATGTDAASQAIGTGDALSIFVATTAQLYAIKKGTAASPDTSLGALFKVERTVNIALASVTGDGGEQMPAIMGICAGTAANEAQPVGVLGAAKSGYTGSAAGKGDACGVYGIARFISTGNVGTAIGGYFHGRRDVSTGRANGLEARCDNRTGTDGTYNSTGFSNTSGIWVTAGGETGRVSGVGLAFGLVESAQWDVGIGFTKIGGVSSIKTKSFSDDSDALTSIQINGSHTTAAIAIGNSSGGIKIGSITAITAGVKVQIAGDRTGATTARAVFDGGVIKSDVVSGYFGFSTGLSTDAAAFTLTDMTHFSASQTAIGAASAVTTQIGFAAQSSLTGAGTNVGFYGNIAAASGRFNFYAAGTAQNKFTGVTGIGNDASSTSALTLAAGTTGVASLRIPHGAAPSSPVDGDIWTTTAGIFVRVNGATVGPLA
jgi:hypothetical protein